MDQWPQDDCCKNCIYHNEQFSQCRIDPPKGILAQPDRFPMVQPHDWCGHFRMAAEHLHFRTIEKFEFARMQAVRAIDPHAEALTTRLDGENPAP